MLLFNLMLTKETINKISQLTTPNGQFINEAPVCIVVFCQETKYYLEDGCAATTNILNAATASGINSCWVAGDKKPYCEDIAKLLSVPSGYKLISLIPLGFSDKAISSPDKKNLNSVIHWEKF